MVSGEDVPLNQSIEYPGCQDIPIRDLNRGWASNLHEVKSGLGNGKSWDNHGKTMRKW